MKIGILDLITSEINRPLSAWPHHFLVLKQSAGIMPQAVSVWCKQMGHQVIYRTYFGQQRVETLLPDDLDVVFISCFTRDSALAYALAKLQRRLNPATLLVLGGPHAAQYSLDGLRFFDVVVQQCNPDLIKEILSSRPRGEVVTSKDPPKDIPCVEERLEEIRTASFWNRKATQFSFIPILSSMGCPFSCDFCVDCNTAYQEFPLDRVRQDLAFVRRHFPRVRINFYDPNFGVRFDRVMQVIESVKEELPQGRQKWFLTEGSLTFLTEPRLKRLSRAGCLCVMPGIESWNGYSEKAGLGGHATGSEKVAAVLDHFELIRHYIPMIQANLLFGLDSDHGDIPVVLNKRFISATPYVFHTLNIPAPFGGTPMFNTYREQGRLLERLPFTFYGKPFLSTTIKHYSPVAFYQKFIEMLGLINSWALQKRAFRYAASMTSRGYLPARSLMLSRMIREMGKILEGLVQDPQIRLFHEGTRPDLPEFYAHLYRKRLGRFASLMTPEDSIPILDQI